MKLTMIGKKAALREFALAVKALHGVNLHTRCEWLVIALSKVDPATKETLRAQAHHRFDHKPPCVRTVDRWAFRNLLRVCGVESRHV